VWQRGHYCPEKAVEFPQIEKVSRPKPKRKLPKARVSEKAMAQNLRKDDITLEMDENEDCNHLSTEEEIEGSNMKQLAGDLFVKFEGLAIAQCTNNKVASAHDNILDYNSSDQEEEESDGEGEGADYSTFDVASKEYKKEKLKKVQRSARPQHTVYTEIIVQQPNHNLKRFRRLELFDRKEAKRYMPQTCGNVTLSMTKANYF
jgi:hypothetical protein